MEHKKPEALVQAAAPGGSCNPRSRVFVSYAHDARLPFQPQRAGTTAFRRRVGGMACALRSAAPRYVSRPLASRARSRAERNRALHQGTRFVPESDGHGLRLVSVFFSFFDIDCYFFASTCTA